MSMVRTNRRTWRRKFACAFRGLHVGMRRQDSFLVHLPCAAATLTAGWLLGVSSQQWCLLLLCIAVVLAAEYFNRALELLAQAIDQHPNPLLADALDVASGSVLVAACGAALTGSLIFLPRLVALWSP